MMQQNKNNDVKQQMSEEELQRTQVLNFETFKKIAHFEKVNSKKPAAILALLGLLLIVTNCPENWGYRSCRKSSDRYKRCSCKNSYNLWGIKSQPLMEEN